jgi:hypothetical protein
MPGTRCVGCAGNYLDVEITPVLKRALPHYGRFGVAAAGNIRRTGSARSGTTRTRT